MSTWARFVLAIGLIFPFLSPATAKAESIPDFCVEGTHSAGAEYLICVPDNWRGTLIIYAHGYVAFNEPVGIPWDQLVLPDGTSLPNIFTQLGFAFATTSYSTNGLAVLDGVEETIDLIDVFDNLYPTPDTILLGGVSEGGLITTLAVEQNPGKLDGGLAACGPIGDFQEQADYFADFRVVFDYLFPDILPPSAVDIPPSVITNWENQYLPAVLKATKGKPLLTRTLINITGASIDKLDPSSIQQTVERVLWYNVFATNDAVNKLGGQPFDNQDTIYGGKRINRQLNNGVDRYSADQTAQNMIATYYQTTGNLSIPLVTLHTKGDEVVPYWHENLYRAKVSGNNALNFFTHIPVNRYGHCNFNVIEVLAGFSILLVKTTDHQMEGVESILTDPISYNTYKDLTETYINN
jgi:pimeloyl-ACP methyl ester carboxylesterase